MTGQQGFIGSHLCDFLNCQDNIEIIPFEKKFFNNEILLINFVSNCDAIVHLAAISRHPDDDFLYNSNIGLTQKLIDAMESSKVAPHSLFGSTTHEARGNRYHISKRDGRRMLDEWANRSGGKSTGLLMPNTFGPRAKPFFNSFVATFCHKVANGETPEIIEDTPVELIYIEDLCRELHKVISGETEGNPYTPQFTAEKKVSEILELLLKFRRSYIEDKAAPEFKNYFEEALFNTFISYI